MIWSTSPASSVSTPSTACTCWIGIETDTTRWPFSVGRNARRRSRRRAPVCTSALQRGLRALARRCGWLGVLEAGPVELQLAGLERPAAGARRRSGRSAHSCRRSAGPGVEHAARAASLGIEQDLQGIAAPCRHRAPASGRRGGRLLDHVGDAAGPGWSGCRCSALIRPRRSSFSTSAPTIRMARPSRLSTMISRPRREPGRRRGARPRLGALRFRGSGNRRHRGFRSRRTPGRPGGTSCACA